MARKASDLIWLGAIVAVVAGGMWFARRSPVTVPVAVGTPISINPPMRPEMPRFSIRGVHIGMTGREALEASNLMMKQDLELSKTDAYTRAHQGDIAWMLPEIHLDSHHHVTSVSGRVVEDRGVRILVAGDPVPPELAHCDGDECEIPDGNNVTLLVHLDANHNVTSMTLTDVSRIRR